MGAPAPWTPSYGTYQRMGGGGLPPPPSSLPCLKKNGRVDGGGRFGGAAAAEGIKKFDTSNRPLVKYSSSCLSGGSFTFKFIDLARQLQNRKTEIKLRDSRSLKMANRKTRIGHIKTCLSAVIKSFLEVLCHPRGSQLLRPLGEGELPPAPLNPPAWKETGRRTEPLVLGRIFGELEQKPKRKQKQET